MLEPQNKLFSIPEEMTYLNCAYMSPLMKEVEEEGIIALKRKSNPGAITANDFFEDTDKLRNEFSKLINLEETNRVVVIPSASYGIANVMKNIHLSPEENVIVVGEQFPSNYYSWERLCKEAKAELRIVTPPENNIQRGRRWNEKILAAIDNNTKLLAMGQVHWADGTWFDLKMIRKRSKEVNALLVIDGTQSVGALPFDIQEIKPDALICASYKWLMGPYSIGLGYYGPYFDHGTPIEENWINRRNSQNFAGLVNYEDQYQPGALRYEVGEHSNFNLVPMLLKALQRINVWTPHEIQAYCAAISSEFLQDLKQSGFWVEEADFRGAHLFGIRLPKQIKIDQLKTELEQANIKVSLRGDAVRISPHVYNTAEDLRKLKKVLLSQLH